MKFRKSMFMLVLVIFLFSIAAAGASDADDRSLASDDTDQMELSSDNTIIEDNLKTSEEKTTLTTGHTVDGNDFDSIQNAIDDARPGDTIFLGGKNYTGNGKYITVDKEVTIIGGFSENDNKYATLDAKSLSRIMNITADNVVLKGIIFTNGKTQDGFTVGRGGAIYGDAFTFSAVNCTFNYNNAYNYGGAIYGDNSYAVNCIFNNNIGFICGAMDGGSAVNCIFNNNEAYNGGAVYGVSAVNCTFNNNHATDSGGAICHGSAVNCIFNNNTAREGGAIYGDYADTCIFKTTSDTALDTTVLSPVLTVDNFNTVINSGKKLTFDLKTNNGNSVTNGNISISVYYKNGAWFGKYNCLSGEEWIPDLPVGSYYAIFDTEYAEFQPINRTINIIPNIPYYVNVTSLTTNNRTVNITAESNLPQDILDCKLLFILPNGTEITANYASNGTWWAVHTFDDYGAYQVNVTYIGLDNVTITNATISIRGLVPISVNDVNITFGEAADIIVIVPEAISGQNLTITVNGISINATVKDGEAQAIFTNLPLGEYEITVDYLGDDRYVANSTTANLTVNKGSSQVSSDGLTTTYQVHRYLKVNLKDGNGNPITGVKVNITINGVTYNCWVDENGNAELIIRLNPGTYETTVTLDNANYNTTTIKTQVVVKKATPKLTAKAKTFKKSLKTKKYTVTLKDNLGKAINKAKVTLKVKGKTYKATTNSKGKATFKITKFTKKGTFKATLTFKGNKYYTKATKKVKIKIK